MEIFIAKGKLVCAPFGAQDRKRPYLMFDNFNLINEDQTGWWHISCSYSKNNEIAATLYNTKIDFYGKASIKNKRKYFLPKTRMLTANFVASNEARYSPIDGLWLKEIRVWD